MFPKYLDFIKNQTYQYTDYNHFYGDHQNFLFFQIQKLLLNKVVPRFLTSLFLCFFVSLFLRFSVFIYLMFFLASDKIPLIQLHL